MHDRDDLAVVLSSGAGAGDPYEVSPEREGDSRHARRQEREARERRRRRRGRRTVVLLVALVLVAGAAFGAYSVLKPMVAQLTASDDYDGAGSGEIEVSVPKGASSTAIGRVLQKADVVKSVDAFVKAAGENPDSRGIQPGRYQLRQQMSGAAAVSLLLDPAARTAERVTVTEGRRIGQVLATLSKASGRPVAEYQQALKDPEALGLPAQAKGRAEGWLFPDTYEFDEDANAADQLRTMIDRTTAVLDDLGVAEDDRQRTLTEASIVQAEGGSKEDFGKIARVIENRLAGRLGNGNRLQMDSTVAYGTGKNGVFTTAAERADASNRYNTYANPGLPVGPIGNPGAQAIQATIAPTPGDWLFFVVVNLDTGETKFSTTKAQHDEYTRQFQAWYRANRG